VLGSDGQKMSKSLRNYPDVSEVFDRDGSDAMRWFLMASSVLRGGNLVVTEEGIRAGVREFLLPLWNAWYFFATYANAAGPGGYEARWRTDSTDVLDRYILALTGDLVRDVASDLEALDSTTAAARLRDFAEALTNWYIRRSRDRFWVGVTDDPASTEAFDTLYTVLETLTRVAAPLIPLVSERVWQGLTGGRSVHLTDWPDAAAFPPRPTSAPRWMPCARCRPSPTPCARRRASACGCRCRASRSWCRTPRRSHSSRTSSATSST
jgi:isoleucyl-tRNA synthetase